jgi:hypothetical protein
MAMNPGSYHVLLSGRFKQPSNNPVRLHFAIAVFRLLTLRRGPGSLTIEFE